ncbi:MAG: EAL domain-containing protein [Gammaproteobacteria bacterium]|nr:EAL domain-containing protein [Gammaproteobacteria bacterium]MDH4315378.1 EAL domain-containing protein [Gammaproteobacteria bacterium]MDH5214617.1 EAL domain-containing protein [Gammaproteobacteria bacterium]
MRSYRVKPEPPKVLLVLLSMFALPPAIAAEGSAEAPFRFYSAVDGLTQSDVYDIEQDQAGYLWFTTARGLNRYDGKTFDHLTIADGLPTNTLTALHVDAANFVWVGDARGGVSVVRAGRVVQTIDPISSDSTPITDIEQVAGRIFLVAEGAGILEVVGSNDDNRLELIAGADIGVQNLSAQGADAWVAASTGLYRLALYPSPQIQKISDSVARTHSDADGNLWVSNDLNEIGIWRDGKVEAHATIDSPNPVINIATGLDGTVWVATESELFSFDGRSAVVSGAARDVKRYDGIDEVSSLFVDRENTLWLSSKSRLIRFLGDRFRHYRLKTAADSETVWSISEDIQGRLWFGTQTKLIVREADETLKVIGPKHGIPRGAVRDLISDGAGNLWVGVRGEGLYKLNTETLRSELIDGTAGLEILDIAHAGSGQIWFSTLSSGVHRYDPQDRSMMRFSPPRDTTVYSLDVWADGNVWYGADEVGLVHLSREDNGGFHQVIFDRQHGLQHVLFDHIRLTGENEAWVATEEGGLYRFESGTFTNIGAATPLKDQTVYLVEPLADGSLVVGGEQGLYQIVPGTGRIAHYHQLVGFMGMETNVHASFIDSRNFLWIGTVDGATRMDISQPMLENIEPTPQIISMETELERIELSDVIEFNPQRRGVFVEFAAVSLLNPGSIEYSYMLTGMDDGWGAATSNRSVSYSSLRPGSYEFLVRARYPGGEWSQRVDRRQFTVQPWLWQQPWFLLLAIAVVLLTIRAVLIYRTRHMEQLNETLRAQVVERTLSIDQARQHLQLSNEKLSREILERQKADKARAEVEARFRQAFENAPIGMGLLDSDGKLFDANPALKNMFWPGGSKPAEVLFPATIAEEDRDGFVEAYQKLTCAELASLDEKLRCLNESGEILQTVVNLSAVRSETDSFLYAVLQVQDVTESRKLTDQLEYQASYDELTGLLNRRSFETQLTRAWERGDKRKNPSYLMFMDLDQFKVVNDTSGHAAGDQLLKSVSEILLENVRADDIVCRLGGDEFGIILWECPTEVAIRIAESIRANIESFRFHWDAETYRIGVSIGGLPIDPRAGDIGELQQLADAACYAAKEAGRNRVHMVAGDTDSARMHRGQVRWVQRLREAMDSNRFAIYAQVIKPLAENVQEPEKLEILLRMRDPETRKLIPPGAFLPAAERYGLSKELDEWVVRSLLDTLFIHQSFQAEHRKYWINLSGTSIGDKRFASFLKDAIKRSPLPPGTINFEITETAVIRSVAEAGKLMSELREMGCKFALDDFGSGLSSFSYLKKLPVDYLKIDGMFIRDIVQDKTDRIFVKSIIDIGHTLNIKSIVEFIENKDMLEVVRELGADYAQGFALGRPFVLAPQFPKIVAAGTNTVAVSTQAG